MNVCFIPTHFVCRYTLTTESFVQFCQSFLCPFQNILICYNIPIIYYTVPKDPSISILSSHLHSFIHLFTSAYSHEDYLSQSKESWPHLWVKAAEKATRTLLHRGSPLAIAPYSSFLNFIKNHFKSLILMPSQDPVKVQTPDTCRDSPG